MNELILQQSEDLKPYLGQIQKWALIIGVVVSAGAVVGYLSEPEQFFRSYLLAFLFWISLSLGSLVILMIHHTAGGTWGFAVRRLLEAGTRTLPLMFILVLPILFAGMHSLYEWTHTEAVHDEILHQKSGYLNESFFIIRTFIYFAIWGLFVYLLNKWSSAQDNSTETYFTRRLQLLSGPGIGAVSRREYGSDSSAYSPPRAGALPAWRCKVRMWFTMFQRSKCPTWCP